ncbi:MAG: F0F1 ATP synthase subunit delta [Candidatus Saccharimonadales bacterium]
MAFDRIDIARGFVARLDKAGAKKAVKELASLLLEQRLHNQAEEILADITKEYARVHGIVEAEARTAFPLSTELKKALSERVKQTTGAKAVILHESVDKSLLGGVIVSAPEMELDLSLRTKLAKLKA